MIVEKWRQNRLRVEQAGHDAIKEAHKAKTAAYYLEKNHPDGIVREMPNGSRQLIRIVEGKVTLIRELPPKRY